MLPLLLQIHLALRPNSREIPRPSRPQKVEERLEVIAENTRR